MSSGSSVKPAIAGLIVLVGIACAIWYALASRSAETSQEQPQSQTQPTGSGEPIKATFTCPSGKSIQATFTEGQVHLVLSDGRELSVKQAISASGARYANPDESFVFWNKGNTALIQENGSQTYADCATQQ